MIKVEKHIKKNLLKKYKIKKKIEFYADKDITFEEKMERY